MNKKGSKKVGKLACIVVILLSFVYMEVAAQDIQFSQFYSNVLYLNPAFAGSSHSARGVLHQRLQWPKLEGRYTTSFFSADTYFKGSKGGLGILFLRDWQGASTLSSTDFSIQYAQEINLTSKWSARLGVQGTYASRFLNYAKLTFPDQYSHDGFTRTNTEEEFGDNRISFLDFSAGGFFYSDHFWFGVASHHLNTPNQSFYGEVSELPMKMAFVAGYKISFKDKYNKSTIHGGKEIYITPTVHYKFQGKSDQLDMGIYGLYDRLLFGFWYRGIPVKHYRERLHNNESLVLLAGLKIHNVRVSYSYDFTISKLTSARTGGAHELNITLVHVKPGKKKKIGRKLPCPDFNK